VDPSSVKRRLTCILAADAVGYSRQMGQDEEGTIRVLSAWFRLQAVIDADGNAKLDAKGRTSNPKFSVGGAQQGTPYTWSANAHFEARAGRVAVRSFERATFRSSGASACVVPVPGASTRSQYGSPT